MKRKKAEPYIDYKKADYLTRLHGFINRANQMRKDMLIELDYMSRTLAIMQSRICEMKEHFSPVDDPNVCCISDYDNDIAALRAYAWEAGLTRTLFEKLKDRDFRWRFTGFAGDPVQQGEIVEQYSWEDEEEGSA